MPECSRAAVRRRPPSARPLLAAALAVLALGGCRPGVEGAPTEADLIPQAVGGRWTYTASDMRLTGTGGEAPCQVTGVVLRVEQLRHRGELTRTFGGSTTGGTLTCRGELAFLSSPIRDYRITNGHTYNENIAFSIGTDDWRHSGFVVGDSIGGQFWLRQGSIQFEGSFVARRTSR